MLCDKKLGQALSDSQYEWHQPPDNVALGIVIDKGGHNQGFSLEGPAKAHHNLVYNEYDEIVLFMLLVCFHGM